MPSRPLRLGLCRHRGAVVAAKVTGVVWWCGRTVELHPAGDDAAADAVLDAAAVVFQGGLRATFAGFYS